MREARRKGRGRETIVTEGENRIQLEASQSEVVVSFVCTAGWATRHSDSCLVLKTQD